MCRTCCAGGGSRSVQVALWAARADDVLYRSLEMAETGWHLPSLDYRAELGCLRRWLVTRRARPPSVSFRVEIDRDRRINHARPGRFPSRTSGRSHDMTDGDIAGHRIR